jgi:Fe-S-cluster containining protein
MRLYFPDDEKKFPWLPLLLDAYAVIDDGISTAIKDREDKQGVKLACKNGCDNCCKTHEDIPVYPLELVGIYWFSVEKITELVRSILKTQLLNYVKGNPCPFLINGSCSIHSMRPLACRQFNVFNKPCDEGEDPFHSRKEDVLTPIEEYTNRAFYIMLPFYGVIDEAEKEHIIKNRLIHTQVKVLQLLNWSDLAKRMDDYDSQAATD